MTNPFATYGPQTFGPSTTPWNAFGPTGFTPNFTPGFSPFPGNPTNTTPTWTPWANSPWTTTPWTNFNPWTNPTANTWNNAGPTAFQATPWNTPSAWNGFQPVNSAPTFNPWTGWNTPTASNTPWFAAAFAPAPWSGWNGAVNPGFQTPFNTNTPNTNFNPGFPSHTGFTNQFTPGNFNPYTTNSHTGYSNGFNPQAFSNSNPTFNTASPVTIDGTDKSRRNCGFGREAA